MRAFALLVLCGCATLSPAPPHLFVPAKVQSVPVTVCWLETGGNEVSGSYGAGGSVRAEKWEVTAAALLVRHPAGDLLIDSGVSPHPLDDGKELKTWGRFIFNQTAGTNEVRANLVELLTAAGVTHLKGVILSHAHADHAGGMVGLTEGAVWVAAPEAELIRSELVNNTGVVLPAHARAVVERMVPIPFEPKPYENYDESWDVFGDGSVVVVPTYGHTPGSVATFVNLSPERRIMHVGDIINLEESLERNVGKSWIMRELTDEDDEKTKEQVRKLIQLHALDPQLEILPAHDRPKWRRLFGDKGKGVPACATNESP